MKSKTIVFTGKGQLGWVEEEVGRPDPGMLLIETEKTLISTGTELTCLERRFEEGTGWDAWVKYPFRPGYCNVGRVVEVGADVKDAAAGDRVFTRGSHAQYVTVPAGAAVKVPDEVDSESAAWGGLGKIVQNGVRRAEHRLGDAVVIVGLGPLGQLAVQYVNLLGPRELIAIDTVQLRLDWAIKHGATHAVRKTAGNAADDVRARTQDRMADVVYDMTGNAAALSEVLVLTRPLGRVVLIGDTGYPSAQNLAQYMVTGGLTLVGAHDSNPALEASVHTPWSHKTITELFMLYLARGRMTVSDLITHRFHYTQAADAYNLLRDQFAETMGVILDWTTK